MKATRSKTRKTTPKKVVATAVAEKQTTNSIAPPSSATWTLPPPSSRSASARSVYEYARTVSDLDGRESLLPPVNPVDATRTDVDELLWWSKAPGGDSEIPVRRDPSLLARVFGRR